MSLAIHTTITARQAARLIDDASAVIFDNMALAFVHPDMTVLDQGDADALWLEYTHVDDEEGLEYQFNFDLREQDITLCGSVIHLIDSQGEKTEIQLLTSDWKPQIPKNE